MDPVSQTDPLDTRKRRILSAIVTDYVATAEPVGSQSLLERYELGVKSATIRNEMAEMSERGFLLQPHTSAGRVPSEQGYRYFVHRLMVTVPIAETEVQRTRTTLQNTAAEMEAILRRTCTILAQMTRLPAVATPPDADDTQLRQLFLAPAGDRTLAVMLLSNGRAENRLLSIAAPVGALALIHALNERYAGQTLARLRALDPAAERPPRELMEHQALWSRIVAELVLTARSLADETPLIVEGTRAALEQPEFRDVDRLGQFLGILQERATLVEMLSAVDVAESPPTVRIGAETGRTDMTDLAVVASPYFVGTRERGSLGVLGPTRMDYPRATAAVRFMAATVGELLTLLSVSP